MFRFARAVSGLASARASSTLNRSQRVVRAALVGGAALSSIGLSCDHLQATVHHGHNLHHDYQKVRAAIEEVLEDGDNHFGPIFVRLAWHASGTYTEATKTGGSGSGASMRFAPESKWGANNGLQVARDRLELVKQQFPFISYADLWTLASVVAIESMGGPVIFWRPGRVDCKAETAPKLVDGLLPDASKGAQHLRDIFYRMGLDDKDIVALSGAHTLGGCHVENSGYTGPWTNAPTTFSNLYFKELCKPAGTWTEKQWTGKRQLEDPSGSLMMLPSDMVLVHDSTFRLHAIRYANDEAEFFKDFSTAFSKLLELGVKFE